MKVTMENSGELHGAVDSLLSYPFILRVYEFNLTHEKYKAYH